MTKVLFIAEAVTWSQVTRLLLLARVLDANHSRFQVHFAASHFAPHLFGDATFERSQIFSLSPKEVDSRIARGGRIYDRATLARYVDEERRLFDRIKPDVIVSDLRWSTCISAPLAGIPLATLVDAYWFRPLAEYPIPDHPLVRLLGRERIKKGFDVGLSFMLRYFSTPVNALREQHGLAPVGDLRDVLGFGNTLLFPDDPSLVPSDRSGVYLGPVIWSPPRSPEDDPEIYGGDRAFVYVTLGSSGSIAVVEKILKALAPLNVDVLLSTAGRFKLSRSWPRVRVVELARGDVAARRARVVICNGGASTGWQALAQGTPVVGVPCNLDAALAMSCIAAAGAGVEASSSDSVEQLRSAIVQVLRSPEIRMRAQEIAASFNRHDFGGRFVGVIHDLVGLGPNLRMATASP